MKNNLAIRAVASITLVAIGAVICLHEPEAPFVITEPVAPAPQPVKPPKPDPAPIDEPAATVTCTFRCAFCRRAPTLQYGPDDVLPPAARCRECGRPMQRIEPPLNAIERRSLGLPQPDQSSRAPSRPSLFCRT